MPSQKDRVDLICDITELAGLFEKSHGLNDFFEAVVSTVAHHMRAAVCSIYLYDEKTKLLTLTANQGLNPDLVGNLSITMDEGLTGRAIREMRPIRVARASRHPDFKFIAGSDEEAFEAFLAVPILQGLRKIGVLVVQDPIVDYFDANDSRALQAIAAQLANTIENARLILSIRKQGEETPEPVGVEPTSPTLFRGKSASPGFASGRATVLKREEASTLSKIADQLDHRTTEDFNRALAQTEKQLKRLQQDMEERLSDISSLIFDAHLLILRDEAFSGAMHKLMREGATPARAVAAVVDDYIRLFSNSENPKLQEKVLDLKDLGHRILHNLAERGEGEKEYEGEIIVAGELLPSDIVRYATEGAEGLILTQGSTTSHVAILARSMRIPTVITDDERALELKEGDELQIDANVGNVYVNPEDEVRANFALLAASQEAARIAQDAVSPETFTRDGTRIHLLANINLLGEIDAANQLKAEGVGLYRSEFPFIVRNEFPSEEEQVRIYRRLVEGMNGKPVTMRTLDIGGDKMLSYYPNIRENNPFLGLRALRFSMRNRDIFCQQLRAMLRAGVDADIGIMFPLVSSVDDFVGAREVVMECLAQLEENQVEHARHPRLGVMIEMPSVVEVIDELAEEADFMCIGSNDLVQYILAVDRTNEEIADMFLFHHPAVLRVLKRVVRAAGEHGKPVSVCGDLVRDPRMLPFLLGIGLRSFSADPYDIPELQQAITKQTIEKAEEHAAQLLRSGKISEVNEILKTVS